MKQFQSLKENWLLLVAVLIVVILASSLTNNFSSNTLGFSADSYSQVQEKLAGSSYYPSYSSDFAPEVQERVIEKTSSLTAEVDYGKFEQANNKIKSIIKSSNSIILNENLNRLGSEKEYFSVNYQLKVETSKYESLMMQLKDTGKIVYLNENQEDITKQKISLESELQAENDRLARYKSLLEQESLTLQEQIDLTDKIFQQERTIKYLEEALTNINSRVSYSTIYLTLQEKSSGYDNIVWVKFSGLVRSFVESINVLISLLFIVLPWAVLALIIYIIARISRKK